MKYTLKALKWAIIILWICFIFLIFTTVYSVANIRVETNETKFFTKNNEVIVAIPFILINDGLYEILNLNVTTIVVSRENEPLTKSTSFIDVIPRGKETMIWHNISLSIQKMVSNQKYLFEDSNFTLLNNIRLDFARIIPFAMSVNSTMPWGAPLYNFTVSEPTFQMINATTSTVSFNISFENHSPYINLEGELELKIFNENEELLGVTYETIRVPSNSFYKKTLSVYIETTKVTNSGYINITFKTSMLNFGPLVIPYGSEE